MNLTVGTRRRWSQSKKEKEKKVYFVSLQIFSQANSPLKRWLLNFAAKRKGAEVSSGIIRSDSIWDKIFFSKIQVNSVSSQ